MRIRNGFVSNSSSSSFILISDKPLLTPEDVAEQMTDDPIYEERFCDDEDCEPSLISKQEAAKFVFSKIDNNQQTFSFLVNAIYENEGAFSRNWTDGGESYRRFQSAQKKVMNYVSSGRYLTRIGSIEDHGEFGEIESGEYFINKIHISEH